jgi:hypothetical protein
MALMSALLHHRLLATGAAEAMGAMPADLSPGLRKDARIGLGKAHGGAPGLLEGQPFRQRELVMGISDLGNIEGKARPILVVEA